MNRRDSSLDPFDYDVEKCGKDDFKKLKHTPIHTCWPGFEEDMKDEDDDLAEEDEENEDLIETYYTNGDNEMVKIFNQKCVIYLERDSL